MYLQKTVLTLLREQKSSSNLSNTGKLSKNKSLVSTKKGDDVILKH